MDWTITKYHSDQNTIEVLLLHEPMENILLGMVSSPILPNNIALVIDYNLDSDGDIAGIGYNHDGTNPQIHMIPEIAEHLKKGTDEAKLILFHEIGHYANKDYLSSKSNKDYGYDKLRVDATEKGYVKESELTADDFAAEYIGKDTIINGLHQLLLRTKESCSRYPESSYVAFAIKEIELRILHQLSKQST